VVIIVSLFSIYRALKTKGNTPKYGLIYHSSYIGKASTQNKGRISRYLANKCAIASRIDCFSGMRFISIKIIVVVFYFIEIPTAVFGDHLKQQVSDRLKFYDSGELPPKNVDVMQTALQEAEAEREKIILKEKKRKKKEKKRRKQAEAALGEDQ
jgi:nucleolar protein 56